MISAFKGLACSSVATLILVTGVTVGVTTAHADQLTSMSLAHDPSNSNLEPRENNSDIGTYLGVGFGKATNRYDEYTRSLHDSAFKVFVGYSYNKYFATELSYINISTGDGQYVDSTVRLTGQSYVGSAVGRLPIGNSFSLMAKLGYAEYETQMRSQGGRNGAGTKGDFSYGVLAGFDLSKHFAVRAEYEAVGMPSGVYNIFTLSGILKF